MADAQNRLFRDASVPRAVIGNAIPSMISMLMVMIYNIADTFFIGQTHDALMVAAVSVVTPLFLLFMTIGTLFGVGGTSLISRTIGKGERGKVKNISSFCFWSGVAVALVVMAVILFIREPVCYLVGASEDTVGYASGYLTIIILSLPFLVISTCFSNILRAEGKPRLAMAGIVGGNILNIVLDPVLILGLDMGVTGAALATAVSNLCAAGFYIIYICCTGRSILSIHPKYFRIGDGIGSGVMGIGIPASVSTILMSVTNMVLNNFMKGYGDMVIAGLGVALKVNMIAVVLLMGLGMGIQPLLGYCYGAGLKKRFDAIMRFSLILAFVISIVMSVVCFAAARPLVTAFLDNGDAMVYGVEFSRIYIISGPIMGILLVFTNAIQSLGASVPSLILSCCRQGIVYFPALLIFNRIFSEPNLIVLAQPVADYITVIISVILFIVTCRRCFRRPEPPAGPDPAPPEAPA